MPPVYPVETSAAALAPEAWEAAPAEEDGPAASGPARQTPLFDDRPKIIPFPLDPIRTKTVTRRRPAARREARPTEPVVAARPGAQAPLDLRSPAPPERKAVNDDAAVAVPAVRLHAALLDVLFLGAGMTAAAAAFHFAGGRFRSGGSVALPYAGAALAVALFYPLFWAVLGRETAGMRYLGLRVLTFDGHRPGWGRLTVRFGLFCLGTVAAGLGLLWALTDDEGLTMHDHISKTFPTRYDPHPSTLRRR